MNWSFLISITDFIDSTFSQKICAEIVKTSEYSIYYGNKKVNFNDLPTLPWEFLQKPMLILKENRMNHKMKNKQK